VRLSLLLPGEDQVGGGWIGEVAMAVDAFGGIEVRVEL